MADELICRCRARMRSGFELDASLAFSLRESPVTVLFGPSGAGKTTLLRVIAGLERPDAGEVSFRGEPWFDASRGIDLRPQQRRAAFLFQDYALFPHIKIEANVAYGGDAARARELMKSFDLEALAARYPRELSGGQQQRVALARALVAHPALLLLDEPLSALDAPSRVALRRQLRRILLDSAVPAIVVTHDRTEAMSLGDAIAVIIGGRIRQFGPAADVFRRPADAEVAAAVGIENIVPAEVDGRESGLITVRAGAQQLQALDNGEGGSVLACFHAEDVALAHEAPSHSSARNRLDARVLSVALEGPLARVELDCGFPLVAVITAHSVSDLGLKPGDRVCAVVKTTAVHLAPSGGPIRGAER